MFHGIMCALQIFLRQMGKEKKRKGKKGDSGKGNPNNIPIKGQSTSGKGGKQASTPGKGGKQGTPSSKGGKPSSTPRKGGKRPSKTQNRPGEKPGVTGRFTGNIAQTKGQSREEAQAEAERIFANIGATGIKVREVDVRSTGGLIRTTSMELEVSPNAPRLKIPCPFAKEMEAQVLQRIGLLMRRLDLGELWTDNWFKGRKQEFCKLAAYSVERPTGTGAAWWTNAEHPDRMEKWNRLYKLLRVLKAIMGSVKTRFAFRADTNDEEVLQFVDWSAVAQGFTNPEDTSKRVQDREISDSDINLRFKQAIVAKVDWQRASG